MFSNGTAARSRPDRLSHFDLGPNRLAQAWNRLARSDVMLRAGLAVLAGLLMWSMHRGWQPPFPYRLGQVPARDIVANVTFEKVDPAKTKEARERARRSVEQIYDHDPTSLIELRAAVKGKLFRVLQTEWKDEAAQLWNEFHLPAPADPNEMPAALAATPVGPSDGEAIADARSITPEQLRKILQDDPELSEFERKLAKVFEDVEQFGLLDDLQHDVEKGSHREITVRLASGKLVPKVAVERVRIAEVSHALRARMDMEFDHPNFAAHLFEWLKARLPRTLTWNTEASRIATDKALHEVAAVMIRYNAGEDTLAAAGKPLGDPEIHLLELEHATRLEQTRLRERIARSAGSAGMYLAMFVLCGSFLFYREPMVLKNLRVFATLLALCALAVVAAQFCGRDPWQAEMVPLVMFGMTAAIAYRQEVAFLLIATIALTVTLALGKGVVHFVIYAATLASTVFLLQHVRSRTKLIYVGLLAAAVAACTTIGVVLVTDRPLEPSVLRLGLQQGLLALLAGLLMTALLPFVENLLDVQTEISLLELGDVAHPLLQELARRAPGTYNHSIGVASIAQAAAESIGANGLLVRVGAYFHDIGKMLKPQYFVENEELGISRHDGLLPAMSTLIIIAHVKDGADLARQHHLPQAIVDFTLQHHGTTLVEFFYDRAHRQTEGNPDAPEIEEHSFRYPGPKPQTREAAVLMLADAAESACRCLPDPCPARIEGLVHDLTHKRLLDGQFDECGLTLQELHKIEMSIAKSLLAMRHVRVRYPEPQTA